MSATQILRSACQASLLIGLFFVAACAQDPVWSKPSGNAEMFKQDSSACYRGASRQAERQMDQVGGATGPQIDVRRRQSTVRNTTSNAQTSRTLEENAKRNHLYSECMHRLGYRKAK